MIVVSTLLSKDPEVWPKKLEPIDPESYLKFNVHVQNKQGKEFQRGFAYLFHSLPCGCLLRLVLRKRDVWSRRIITITVS